MRLWRTETKATIAAFLLALAAVTTVAIHLTDGFRVFTLESARRTQALRNPQDVRQLRLAVLDSENTSLGQFAGRWVLVDFIYTRCETLCVSLGSVYARLQDRLSKEIASGKVQLLSISFDPEHDGLPELAAYRNRHVKSSLGWTLGRPQPADLSTWIKSFGVVVIPDEQGGFIHNAAIHVVSPDGRLRAIVDWSDIEAAAHWVESEKL